MEKIKVAVAGFGLSGRVFHYPLIVSDDRFRVVAIQSSNPEATKNLSGDIGICATFDPLLAVPSDLVIIANPNHLHGECARKALEASRHVVVEKPFTVSSVEAMRLCELAKKQQRMLTVFHNRRWDADFLTIKSLINRGILGGIVHFESHFDRYKPKVDARWKEQAIPGGGVLYDLGSHLIDQALQLFGSPKRVFADLSQQRDHAKQDDYFHLILDYGPMRVILHAGALVAQVGPRFIVHGRKGSFVKYGMDPQEDQLKSGMDPGSSSFGTEADRLVKLTLVSGLDFTTEVIPGERGDYRMFYESVARAILTNASPAVLGLEALTVIRMIEWAQQSAERGEWIACPDI
ncbi:MAG: oxidoreductase [Proteobacteria bacterium]|nr:oxidoreductase [Pseudomonadota bacterium]